MCFNKYINCAIKPIYYSDKPLKLKFTIIYKIKDLASHFANRRNTKRIKPINLFVTEEPLRLQSIRHILPLSSSFDQYDRFTSIKRENANIKSAQFASNLHALTQNIYYVRARKDRRPVKRFLQTLGNITKPYSHLIFRSIADRSTMREICDSFWILCVFCFGTIYKLAISYSPLDIMCRCGESHARRVQGTRDWI